MDTHNIRGVTSHPLMGTRPLVPSRRNTMEALCRLTCINETCVYVNIILYQRGSVVGRVVVRATDVKVQR